MASPNSIYDPETDDRRAADHVPSDDVMRSIPGIDHDEEADIDREALQDQEANGDSLYNPGGVSEEASTAEAAEESDTLGKGYTDKGGGKKNVLARSRNFISRHKVGLTVASAPAIGVVGGILLLFLFASSLKIPNLAQNITTYEFARLTRQYAQSAQRVTEQELGLAATNDPANKNSTYQQLKDKYAKASTKVSNSWAKLDKYRPQRVIDTLGADGKGVKLNFQGDRLLGVELDGLKYDVAQQGKATKYIPGLSRMIDFKNTTKFYTEFRPVLNEALQNYNTGTTIRGVTANTLRKKLGIGLVAWTLSKFNAPTADETKAKKLARLEEERQKIQNTDGQARPSPAVTGVVNEAVQAERTAVDTILKDPELLQQAIDSAGFPTQARVAVDKVFAATGLKTFVAIADPIYEYALPICIIYDGSLNHSGPVIDQNTRQQEAAFYYVNSGADQQKQGPSNNKEAYALANAVSATNDDLGDISKVNSEIQAGGGTPDTTSSTSAEAGAAGDYSLIDAIPGLSALSWLDGFATQVCPLLTDLRFGLAIGTLNALASFFSGGALTAAEKGAGVAATTAAHAAEKKLGERLVLKILGNKVGGLTTRSSKLLFGTGKDAVKSATAITGVTVLAKLIVEYRANHVNSGFAQGTDLAINAAAGGNLHANELERMQNFGRALTPDEVAQSDLHDTKFVAMQNSSKSFTDRYFALSNTNSLVSRMAMGLTSISQAKIATSIMKLGAAILKPMTYVGSLLSSFSGVSHAAAPVPGTRHYGNIQFGWSEAEEKLVDSDNSYQMLANQAILDTGNEAGIAAKYARCFGYSADASGALTLAAGIGEEGSLGTLLSHKDDASGKTGFIRSEPYGDIVDTENALCSPTNLSYDSGDPLAVDIQGGPQGKNDMIFRWRLAQFYSKTVDQLTSMQSVTH